MGKCVGICPYFIIMLNKTEIENNKQRFKDLVSSISRLSDEELHNVLSYFDNTDFFVAPASTKYHGAYEGGLCEHSLKVYDNLKKLYDTFHFNLDQNDQDSITIVSLFHDLGKINFYKKEIKHRKVYDKSGNSKWEDYLGYNVVEPTSRFLLGNHEENCAYLASTLVPLRASEYSAILNHHGTLGWDSAKGNISEIYDNNALAQFLHYADSIDAYDPSNK